LLICDHAGRLIPARLGDLGVSPSNLERHIAWDIGAAGVARELARTLDAVLVHQRYSRLVIDCNRAPDDPGSIVAASDGVVIPGNRALGPKEREARRREIFQPYQDRVAAILGERLGRGQPSLLVSLHSFTPSMGGVARPWRFGVLHLGDSVFSRAVLAVLRADWGEAAGDNQPYAMDRIDFTIPHHARAHGLDYLELEIRQDLISTPDAQVEMARLLAGVLARAAAIAPPGAQG